MEPTKGRLTIPTDLDVVDETLELYRRWGADAVRDADGTQFPRQLQEIDGKIYATYYTTRKDNAWAKANPREVQQCYIMTNFTPALGNTLAVPLMRGISPELMQPNSDDDVARWWEVIDRTAGAVVPPQSWRYNAESQTVEIAGTVPYHEYTVSFLAYLIWDPVHMYNAVVNGWQGVEHQITFDVRQPKTRAYTMRRLRQFIKDHPYVDVLRFTTFFHQFTLVFDELRREKYVDWYGYTASVSPYILRQFEEEVGYPFRPEYIIDAGYYNNQYRVPTKEYMDFMAFQRREVAKLAKEMVDIAHEEGKEAMMFLGDHFIGTEPFMPEFKTIGLDAVVGSVGNGATLRLISDIPGLKYTEGRFLPYFFPDTFHEGGDPVGEAKYNWVTARRAILRKPVDRIGYGGYLKLALQFPDFINYVEQVANEFRLLYANIQNAAPYCAKTVAVVNCWGKMRSWGNHMVHHALYQPQNVGYAGVMEALAGAPFNVQFLGFEELLQAGRVPEGIDVVLMVGDGDTAHTGGALWETPALATLLRAFVHGGGGLLGVGEPSGHQYGGHYLQLAGLFGVEKETGFTLGYDKYNWQPAPHFILNEGAAPNFGRGKRDMYALPGAQVLAVEEGSVQLAANSFGAGRCVYISGLPYSFANARVLHRAVLWAAGAEAELHRWFSQNCNIEVNAYPETGKYCVVNNTEETQATTVWRGDGSSFAVTLAPGAIQWYNIKE